MHCHNNYLKQNTKWRKIMTLDTLVKHQVSSDFCSTLYKEHLKNCKLLKTIATKLEIMILRNKFMLDKVWWGWKTQPYISCTGMIKTVPTTFSQNFTSSVKPFYRSVSQKKCLSRFITMYACLYYTCQQCISVYNDGYKVI